MSKEMLMSQEEINHASEFKIDEIEINAASGTFILFAFYA